MGYGEDIVVRKLNDYFRKNRITAFAYRNKQSRFSEQSTDINVDSRVNKYYMAIEVKSKRGKSALNFKKDFTTSEKTGEHQLDRQLEYAKLTGRLPYIILFCRIGRGKSNVIYVFDSKDVKKLLTGKHKSVLAKEFDSLNKENELWRIIND